MKKEHSLNQLIRLVESLDPSELKMVKNQIKLTYSKKPLSTSKVYQLVELMLIKNSRNTKKITDLISDSIPSALFNKIIKKTINFILESLLKENLYQNKRNSRAAFREQFLIKRQLLKIQILVGRSHHDSVKSLIQPIIKRAKKFELYNELLEALYILQGASLTDDNKKFDAIGKEIKFYEDCRYKLLEASMIYQKYGNEKIKTAHHKEFNLYTSEVLCKLLKYSNDTNSSSIKCYYYLILIEINYRKGDYINEFKVAKKLLQLLKSNEAVYSKGRISLIYTNLTNTAIAACQFNLSNKLAIGSNFWSRFDVNINQIYSHRSIIKSLIYLEKPNEAYLQIDKLNRNKYINQYPFFETYFNFLKSVCSFLLKNFQLTIKQLNTLKELEKDKEGWNIWVQVLRIQAYIELERFTEVEFLIENLRKYLIRIQKKYTISQRPLLISKLLVALKGCNFDFKLTAKKKPDLLEKLTSLNEDCRWDGRTPEMILFHDWFDAKVNQAAYQPNFEPYRVDLEVDEQELEMIN